MTDAIEDVFDNLDIEEAPGPTEEQRKTIVELCRQQVRQERLVNHLEAELHIAQDTLRMISEVQLPNAMMEAGITREDLANGASVALKASYHPKQLSTPEGLEYLISQGAGSLIKHDIGMQFGREQEKLVHQILNRISKWKSSSNFKVTEKRAVNAQTLRGYVYEQIKAGNPVPFDLLGVHVRHFAEVVLPEKSSEGKL